MSYYPNTMVNQVVHANGVTDTYGKDPNDMARPASIATSGAATNWSTGTYQYDGAGDVWKIGSDWYLYDPVTRLKEGNVGSVTQKQCAVFDAFGNILGLSQIASTGTCPTTGSYALDSSTNRFLSPVTYDAAGNETSRGGFTFTWDKWSQMATAVGTGVNRAYLYTADGERIGERDNVASTMTLTVRDLSNKVLRVFTKASGTWGWSKDYVYRDGLLLASIDSTGTKHFHLDHLGTVRRITGTGTPAAVLASHDYYPFGLEATSSAQDTERMKYTGHERDSSTGLDYMHARHYNSVVGRFISTDPTPKSIDVDAPQSLNRYAYVQNRPVGNTDPKGTCIEDACVIEGALLATITIKVAADLTAWLNAQSPVHPGMTNAQAMLDSAAVLFRQAAQAAGRRAPNQPTNEPSQYDKAKERRATQRANEPSPGGDNQKPGGETRPGAPGPDSAPRDLGPSPGEDDIFRWTQPTFPAALGLAAAAGQSSQNQVYNEVQQSLLQEYGLGPWLQSDPDTFMDTMGNSAQDPNPR